MEDKQAFYLMHKDLTLRALHISKDGKVTLGGKNPSTWEHYPLGCSQNDSNFSSWWKNRSIPDNRDGIKKALKDTGYESTGDALVDNFALSLTDCYWIKPSNSSLKWSDVNLYKNEFIDRIGEALFSGKTKTSQSRKNRSIGSTSGELKKKWSIDKDNKRILIKGNIGKSYQQSLNEVFISKIHQQLNPKFALQYDMIEIDIDGARRIIGCKSKDFCNDNVEFVSASEIVDSRKLRGSDNPFTSFKEGCLELGMNEKEFDDYMDYLIVTDFIFTNIDRHLNNIGILRNPDTLELIGFSPIFDSGNSMFYNYSLEDLKKVDFSKIKINSFFNKESKMLKYVKNLNIINLDNIKPDFSIYDNDIEEEKIRYSLIEELFYKKIEILKKYKERHYNHNSLNKII